MAGASAQFNAEEFRTAIRTAMVLGQPNDTNQQVTFVFLEKDTYSPEGPDDDPYSWTQTPTTVVQAAKNVVQVNCAVEYAGSGTSDQPIGDFDASRVTLTILDEDYAKVAGADQVLVGGYTYVIESPGAIPFGLFDVTVYQIHLSARS